MATPGTPQPGSDAPPVSGTPAPSSPAAPASPSAPAAQPAGPTPASPAAPSPGTPAVPAAAPVTPTAPAADYSDLLADDLKTPVAEPPAAGGTADLATKYANDPAVLAVLTEHGQYKPLAETIKGNRYAIPDPAELKLQLEDSNTLYDVMSGKAPASALLETMMANPNWTQEIKQKVIADLAQFVSKATGQPIAAAAAGQVEDPAMAEIKKMRAEQAADRAQQENAKLTARVNTAKTTITAKVNELLTGTFLEGEGDYVYSLIGSKFPQERAMELVEAAERGDFTQIQKAFQVVKNEEAVRYVARNQRMIELAKKRANTIPKQVAGGTPPAPAADAPPVIEMDANKRRAQMLKELRGQ